MFPNFTVLYLYLIINFRNCKKVKTHFNTRIPPASSVTKTKPTPTPINDNEEENDNTDDDDKEDDNDDEKDNDGNNIGKLL